MTDMPPVVEGSTSPVHKPANRLVFVDVLRVGVIVWVVGHHAAQPYGATGGDWPITDQGKLAGLGPL